MFDRSSPSRSLLFVLAPLAFAGCATSDPTDEGLDESASFIVRDGDPSAQGVLRLVNTASFAVLDDDVALDRRAATNIVAHRRGLDGVERTADDDPFDTIAELDAIAYVGPSALDKLVGFAEANGWTDRHRSLGDGVVLDQDTGLVWQEATLGPASWYVATGYGGTVGLCEGSTLGGRTWRAPTRAELLTLVDRDHAPMFDPIYARHVPLRPYWTSEIVPDSAWSHAFTVDFSWGGTSAEWPSSSCDIRCIAAD